MKRKTETIVLLVCTLLLGASGLNANVNKAMNPLGFQEVTPVPEPGFLGASGVLTVIGALGYGAVKAYRAIVGRKRE